MGSRCQPWRSMPIQEKRNGGSHGDAAARRKDGEIGRREERRDNDRGNAGRAVLRHGPISIRRASCTREGGRGRLQRQRIPAGPTGLLPAARVGDAVPCITGCGSAHPARREPTGGGCLGGLERRSRWGLGWVGAWEAPSGPGHWATHRGPGLVSCRMNPADLTGSRSVTGMMGTGGTRSLPWDGRSRARCRLDRPHPP